MQNAYCTIHGALCVCMCVVTSVALAHGTWLSLQLAKPHPCTVDEYPRVVSMQYVFEQDRRQLLTRQLTVDTWPGECETYRLSQLYMSPVSPHYPCSDVVDQPVSDLGKGTPCCCTITLLESWTEHTTGFPQMLENPSKEFPQSVMDYIHTHMHLLGHFMNC